MLTPLLCNHYLLHCYYELVRLLTSHLLNLGNYSSLRPNSQFSILLYWRTCKTSQVWLKYQCRTRHTLRPRQNSHLLAISSMCYCLLPYGRYQLLFVGLTRLNSFTLSHYGSNSPWFTLKPNLTTSAPKSWY